MADSRTMQAILKTKSGDLLSIRDGNRIEDILR